MNMPHPPDRPFKASLVLRSAILVLLVSGVVGFILLTAISRFIEPVIEKSITARLDSLVSTIESTARIASFLGDASLASEVAKGLMMNSDVARVIIINEQGTLVDSAHLSAAATPAPQAGATQSGTAPSAPTATFNEKLPEGSVVRLLSSPFNEQEQVGRIIVVRNQESIRSQVKESVSFIQFQIILQTSIIVLVVMLVAVLFIARPIQLLSKRLNALSATSGEKLTAPVGHRHNEIGQLVNNVNALIDRLVQGMMIERDLRVEREIEERRFRAIFENAETGIFVIDRTGLLKSFNPAFSRAIGFDDKEHQQLILGQPLSLLERLGELGEPVRELIQRCLVEHKTSSQEIMLVDNQHNPRWVNMILNPVEDDLIQGVINDITENKLREAHANKLALTDPLTGLGNRLGFERQIEQLLNERAEDPECNFTLVMLDLDRFKQVNDTHGHDVGDAVLIHVAQQIQHSIRKSDFAARLGGDEFVVLLPMVTDRNIITRLAKTLISNISQPIHTQHGVETSVGASLGISLVNRPAMLKDEIIKQADLALYAVKAAGRNDFRIFDASETKAAST